MASLSFFVVAVALTLNLVYTATLPGYCAAPVPQHVPLGNDKTLVQVHVFNRHGDRAPVGRWGLNGTKYGPPSFNCEPTYTTNSKASRMYTVSGGGQYYPGSCATGELTAKGSKMLTAVGAGLRSVYVEKLNFLSPNISKDEVLLYASGGGADRCLHSLAFSLDGMYPEMDTYDEHIHISQFEDIVDPLDTFGSCTKFTDAIVRATATPAFAKYTAEVLLPNMAIMAHDLGIPIKSLDWVPEGALDFFGTLFCHNHPFPGNISFDVANKLAGTAHIIMKSVFELEDSRKGLAGPTMAQLFSALENKSEYKFVQWSGHDTTLTAILGALGQFGVTYPADWPPYASVIRFEVARNSSGQYIRGIYNNELMNFSVSDSYGWIPYSYFMTDVQAYVAGPDWNKYCKFRTSA